MRVFLLPISTRRALVYCNLVQGKSPTDLSLVQKAINKVPKTWAKWETAKSGWKKIVTEYGNQALQRIPYQEWGLKSFPPFNQRIQADALSENKKFEVIYPANIIQSEDVPKILRRLASERKQLHWNRFMGSLIGMPFTIPLAVVPIIPNLPFFYLAFRSYSHWRALKGSDHIDFLVDYRLLKLKSSSNIEAIYKNTAPNMANSFTFVTRSQVLEGIDPNEKMLLQVGSHQVVADSLKVPELAAEVERAVRQVKESLNAEEDQERRRIVAPRKGEGIRK